MESNYWSESTRPLTSLAFIAPLLFVYEAGMVLMGPEPLRNGADAWLRQILVQLGFGQYFLLPVLTCSLLLGWHHVTRQRWTLKPDVLGGMLYESMGLAIGLLVLAKLQGMLSGTFAAAASNTIAAIHATSRLCHAFGYLGAGIYEELLFRLLILQLLARAFRVLKVDGRSAIVAAVATTSVLFAAAHYRLFFHVGDAFCWYSFSFRAIAGVFFSVLYLRRGFGITVGTHTIYDLIAGSL